MLHLDHGVVWCLNLNTSGSRSEIPGNMRFKALAAVYVLYKSFWVFTPRRCLVRNQTTTPGTNPKTFIQYLGSFEMWCWRRMENISWTDYMRNKEVLQRVEDRAISYIQ